MVELLLVSVAVVAVFLFLMNLRSVGGTRTTPPALDGSPKWVDGTIVSITPRLDFLGHTSARIDVSLGGRDYTATGLVPADHASQLVSGAAVSGHVEYDELDTLHAGLWEENPGAALVAAAALADVAEADLSEDGDAAGLDGQLGEHTVWLGLSDDGWLTLMVTPLAELDPDLSFDLRTDWPEGMPPEEMCLVGEKLAADANDAAEPAAAAFIAALEPELVARLEAFALATDGWITVAADSIDFECALPFAEPSLIAALIRESLVLAQRLDREPAAAAAAAASDGEHW